MPEGFLDFCSTPLNSSLHSSVPAYIPTPILPVTQADSIGPLCVEQTPKNFFQNLPITAEVTDWKVYKADIFKEDERLVAVIRKDEVSMVSESEEYGQWQNGEGDMKGDSDVVEDIKKQLLGTDEIVQEEANSKEEGKSEIEIGQSVGGGNMLVAINRLSKSLERTWKVIS